MNEKPVVNANLLRKEPEFGTRVCVYMPTPEPHLHGVRTAPYRILNRILPEQNRA